MIMDARNIPRPELAGPIGCRIIGEQNDDRRRSIVDGRRGLVVSDGGELQKNIGESNVTDDLRGAVVAVVEVANAVDPELVVADGKGIDLSYVRVSLLRDCRSLTLLKICLLWRRSEDDEVDCITEAETDCRPTRVPSPSFSSGDDSAVAVARGGVASNALLRKAPGNSEVRGGCPVSLCQALVPAVRGSENRSEIGSEGPPADRQFDSVACRADDARSGLPHPVVEYRD